MSSHVDTPEGRKWIVDMLRMGPVKITFTKKDGTERLMNCTLKSDLTESYEKKTDKVKESNPEVCPVFDIEARGWRSFRYDSVRSVEFKV